MLLRLFSYSLIFKDQNCTVNIKYPFDPLLKHHVFIALGLGIWIFLFLYVTEPMDVNEFGDQEKLIYLPIYGVIAAACYLLFMPLQNLLYRKSGYDWRLKHELIFLICFVVLTMTFARLYYLFVIVADQPNPYSLWYHIKTIFLPALTVTLPIVIINRFAFGKYKEKKLEQQKIEIEGEGQYESVRLLPDDLICIQSADNYVEVFYRDGSELKKTLIRNKLSIISDTFPELLRTHRSFIINPFHFKQWKTDNGKHLLQLSHNIEVPISKTYLDKTKARLNFTTV
ncbi:MAG: LytTR family transcriptional regulator [Psychroserpens sp.]|nr:LytTR family transcriptional regulator [Psychroserpens sp.]MBO6631400.1 LytTR family transcriptional regulator [Psychroserpens sp.]MBO6653148.1 LytTR family transcriptional regulator [Psychroserpens sp.]MBO6680824.1 LytTR family transcriptional regulator [Psychroserpens sp.]MBO6750218.1 LytTR family transcriptional regulator [Psychroserpens sp.]